MKRLYTAESVTEGHPDKVWDRIADTILDACLAKDPDTHVACEVLATKGTVLLAGEISSSFEPDMLSLAEEVVGQVGYDPKAFLFDSLIHRRESGCRRGVEHGCRGWKHPDCLLPLGRQYQRCGRENPGSA